MKITSRNKNSHKHMEIMTMLFKKNKIKNSQKTFSKNHSNHIDIKNHQAKMTNMQNPIRTHRSNIISITISATKKPRIQILNFSTPKKKKKKKKRHNKSKVWVPILRFSMFLFGFFCFSWFGYRYSRLRLIY